MPSLNLRNPLRRDPNRPTLKQRAATLKASAARLIRKPKPLPAAGSPEALEAFGAACRAVDAASRLGDADMEALRIAPGASLWTSDKVTDALSGNFTRFDQREIEAARATPRARLEEMQVLALRRELRMAEAAQTSRIRELYALVYGDEPDPTDEDEAPAAEEPAIAQVIEAHRTAQTALTAASWAHDKDHVQQTGGDTSDEAMAAAQAAWEAADAAETQAWTRLLKARPASAAGLLQMLRYIRGATIGLESVASPCEFARDLAEAAEMALGQPAALSTAADAELIALGHAFDAATIRHREACDALDAAEDRAMSRIPERPEFAGEAADRGTVLNLTEAANEIADEAERSRALARIGELSAALDAWEAERDQALDDESVTEARAGADEASDAAAAIAQQATALPARTLAGVWVKVRIAAFYGVADPTASPAEGYTGEAALRSLYRDAPRLVLDAETADIRILPEADATTGAEPDPHLAYRDRLITAMAERWCARAFDNAKEPSAVERRAYDLVWSRLAGLIEEVSALPPPRTPQGLNVLATAAAAQLEGAIGPTGDFSDERMAANLIRGTLTATGTQLPPVFIGFGDEPDFKDRENVAFSGPHAFPGWALTAATEA